MIRPPIPTLSLAVLASLSADLGKHLFERIARIWQAQRIEIAAGCAIALLAGLLLVLWRRGRRPTARQRKQRRAAHGNRASAVEAGYRAVLAALPEAVLLLEPDSGLIVEANPAAARLLFTPAQELAGRGLERWCPGRPAEGQGGTVLPKAETSSDRPVRTAVLRSDGTQLPVELFARPLHVDGTSMNLVFLRELGAGRRREGELPHSQRTLQAILDALPLGMVVVGKDKRVRRVNPAALKTLGYSTAGELLGKRCHATFCAAERDACPVLDLGESIDRTERLLTNRDGIGVPVLQSVIPVSLDNEEVLVGVFVETTERKRAERALRAAKNAAEAADRLKSEFLTNVSHEIRTPLNGIIGFAEIILEEPSAEQCHECAEVILRESRHLLHLINDLLDHVKMGSGRLQLDCRPVDLHRLVEGATEGARVQAEAKGLRLRVTLDGRVPRRIVADPLRLEQVLRNLLDNAVKFTEQGSVSLAVETLEVDEGSATLRFSVVDTGIGIPKEKRDLIFQSFTQADGSTTRKHRGTGLGTTIARTLVQLMGGDIGVQSEPGEGSVFFFALTFETADAVSPGRTEADEFPAPATARKHPPTGKVLVADDYPTNQQVARCHLESAGHTVRVVGTGDQAVAAFQEDAFDLVLMDVQMPNLDGYQAARQIRSLGPPGAEIPILAMTTPATSAARRACREAGIDDIVVKPLNRERFLALVAEWMAIPRKVALPAPANESPTEKPVEPMRYPRAARDGTSP